ncbi:MAG: hypothetical protein HZA68_21165 [Rhodovulum sp.]|nr:hypothetical protein [Rhodovulum sp.]
MWTTEHLAALAEAVVRGPCRDVLVLGPAEGPVAATVQAVVAARQGCLTIRDPSHFDTIPPAASGPASPPSRLARLRGWLAGRWGRDGADLVVVDDLAATLAAPGVTEMALARLARGGRLIAREPRRRDVMALLDHAPADRWFASAVGDAVGAVRVLVCDRPGRLGRRRLAKRVDACLLYNELDLLEIRLEELWEHVDHLVVVEAETTFAGRPKPLFLRENAARFAPYAAKLVHHVVAAPSQPPPRTEAERFAWEARQRDAIGDALAPLRLSPDDIAVVGDVDEIPRGTAVERVDALLAARDYAIFVLANHRGYLNNLSREALNGTQFAGPVACRVSTLRREGAQAVRRGDEKSGHVVSQRSPAYAYVEGGGWHFSSLGGPEAVWLKAANFSHIEDPYRVIGLGAAEPGQQVFGAALDRETCRARQRLYLAHCEQPAFAPLDFDRFEVTADLPAHLVGARERYRGFFFFTDLV